jgi:hypothetical protein
MPPKTENNLFTVQDEMGLIEDLNSKGELLSFSHTQEMAWELLFNFGFSRTAVINSDLASRKQVDTVIRNQKRGRMLHQPGRRNILDYVELQELYDWIDFRIYRHEQPKGWEVENEVFVLQFFFVCLIIS